MTLFRRLPRRFQVGLGTVALFTFSVGAVDGFALALVVPALAMITNIDTGLGDGQLIKVLSNVLGMFGARVTLLWVLVLVMAAMGLRSVGLVLQHWVAAFFRARLERDLKEQVLINLMGADWLYLTQGNSGAIANIATTETRRSGEAYQHTADVIAAVLSGAAYFTVAMLVSWSFGLAAFGMTTIIALTFFRFVRRARMVGVGIGEANQQIMVEVEQVLGGLKAIKSSAMEAATVERFNRATARLERAQVMVGRIAGMLIGMSEMVFITVLLASTYVAMELLGSSASNVMLFGLLFYRLFQQVRRFQTAMHGLAVSKPGIDLVEGMVDQAAAARERSGGIAFQQLRDGVALEEVSFAYQGRQPVLRNVSIRVARGQLSALVGASGAGKTTALDLFLGLLRPTSGRVLVDGQDLAEIDVHSWREGVAYVAQDSMLFHDSIRNNLAWANPQASEDEMERALAASAAEFVHELPEGLDTVVGDRGARLSGGQRQRLALARALLRRPQLLVLDEATNQMDTETEARVQRAIEQLRGEMTVLVVAHRLSTVRQADRIYVLEHGQMVEQGTYAELLAEGGVFSRLVLAGETGE